MWIKNQVFSKLKNTQRVYGGLVTVLGILVALGGALPLFKMAVAWELDSLNVRQKWNPPEDRSQKTPIRLIGIGPTTESNPVYRQLFGESFSRRAAGYAIRFLNRTRPKAIILDVSFNGGEHQNDRAGDQFLVDSIQPPTLVISQLMFEKLGQFAQGPEQQTSQILNLLNQNSVQVQGLEAFPRYQDLYRYNSLVPPYPQLLNSGMRFYSATLGDTRADATFRLDDTQTQIRRWIPFSVYGNTIYPTLPLGVVSQGAKTFRIEFNGKLHWQNQTLDLGRSGLPLIKWYGHGKRLDRPVYPEYAFADVVLSELSMECQENPARPICHTPQLPIKPILHPQVFQNQFALIGYVSPNRDVHPTLYSSRYPGFYIMANVLDNALHNDFVRPAPGWLNLLLFVTLPALLILTVFRFQSTLMSLLMAITLSAGHFLLCLHAYYAWNLWVYAIYPILALWACFCGLYVYQYAKEHRQREQMRFAFGKYVSPTVLKIIEQQAGHITLGGERREMTFMFSDIRGFTAFSDQNEPEVVQTFLTQYFSTMNGIIMHQYRGSINKLIGDAIMAYWGFPLSNEDHAFLAVSAAMAMREATLEWHDRADKLPIHIGIGINTGDAVIGNIGSEDFMDFTVIGDAVNVASRLESLNKEYGTTIIISSATYQQVKDRIEARSLGWCTLKGKSEPTEIFEPLRILPISNR